MNSTGPRAFLVLTIGKSPAMSKKVAATFGDRSSMLSPSAWIIRADEEMTPHDIAKRIDAKNSPHEVLVLQISPHTPMHAEPALAAWFRRSQE